MKRRHAGDQPDNGQTPATTGVAPGKRTLTGSLPPVQRQAPSPPEASHGFYPLPPAAHDTDESPASFTDTLVKDPDDPKLKLAKLERELSADLDRYDALQRRVQSGDGAATRALREVRARILGHAEQIRRLSPDHALLSDLPEELDGPAGVGATVEELVRRGSGDIDDQILEIPGVAPMLCEREGASDDAELRCFLTETQRSRIVAELGQRAGDNAARWMAAVQTAVTDELLHNETAWGFIAEVLFNMASFGTTSALARAARAMSRTSLPGSITRALAYASEPKNIKDTVATLGKGAREKIKQSVTTKPSVSKIEVLQSLRGLPGSWAQEVRANALTVLDDAELLAVNEALDPDRPELQPEAYDARVSDLAARFSANVLAVGQTSGHGHNLTTAARLHAPNGAIRVALVRYDNLHTERSGSEVNTAGDDAFHFVQWVETDFAPAAIERQEALLHNTSNFMFPTTDPASGEARLVNRRDPAISAWLKANEKR